MIVIQKGDFQLGQVIVADRLVGGIVVNETEPSRRVENEMQRLQFAQQTPSDQMGRRARNQTRGPGRTFGHRGIEDFHIDQRPGHENRAGIHEIGGASQEANGQRNRQQTPILQRSQGG